jgi:hypothetical protein
LPSMPLRSTTPNGATTLHVSMKPHASLRPRYAMPPRLNVANEEDANHFASGTLQLVSTPKRCPHGGERRHTPPSSNPGAWSTIFLGVAWTRRRELIATKELLASASMEEMTSTPLSTDPRI